MQIILVQLKKIVYSLTVAIFVVTVFGWFVSFDNVHAQESSGESTYYGLETVAKDSGLIKGDDTGDLSLATKIGKIIRPIMGLTGSIFLVLTIYAGVMWMTAAGNEERVAKAKKIITTAAIGLFVVVMAYAITSFIGNALFEREAASMPPAGPPGPPS